MMKKLTRFLGVLTMLMATHFCWAQSDQGVITYEAKVNLHRRLPPEREEMKKMIPEFRSSTELLVFNATESLYKPVIEDEPESENEGGMRVQMSKPYFENYLESKNKKVISKREFMGKDYLIEDNLKMVPWKFSNETKTIQGYECKQAYYATEETKQTVTAWYTSEIRPFLGPNSYNTLPGTVLALDINNEEQIIVATKIEFRGLKKNELKIPKGGESITEEEFRKMVDERMKQMGGHGIMIRN